MAMRVECPHGYLKEYVDTPSEYHTQQIACRDVEICPAYAPAKFSDDDLNLIMAMCKTANPWFPERDMHPAWDSVYRKAQGELLHRTSLAKEK